MQTDDYIEEQIEICDDDSPEFAQFVARAVPRLIHELEKNRRSHAFDGADSTECSTSAAHSHVAIVYLV